MTRRAVRLLVTAVTVVALLGLAGPTYSHSADRKRPAAPDRYNVPIGVKFNNPYGSIASERNNFRHLLRTINSTKKRERIRIASWNVRSRALSDAVIAAHRRGVSVRIVMDRVNATTGTPNRDVARIITALKQGNKHRRPSMRSWLRKCISACRGRSGIAHTKFYLFSKVRKKKDVVIFGSNNLTELAATIQWNDLFTIVDNPDVYAAFEGVFNEMAKDKAVRGGGFRQFTTGPRTLTFYPYTGPIAEAAGDPDMNRLNAVRCSGATGGTGNGAGKTKIRIAQTAMYGPRGIALANKLAALRRNGCDIRIVYAMFGREVLKILRGARVGLTHLAYDADEDGIYDRYVHMKSMTISGVYGKKTNAMVTVNGSANLTSVALASDEIVGEFRSTRITNRYQRWIDYMYTHRPRSWGADTPGGSAAARSGTRVMSPRDTLRLARELGVDPYAIIKQDL